MENNQFLQIAARAINDESYREMLRTDFYGEMARQSVNDANEIALLQNLLTRVVDYESHLAQIASMQDTIGKMQFSPAASEKYRQKFEDFSIDQLETTQKTSNKFKEGLVDSLDQIKHGFKTAMIMYTVAFYVGILLIVASLVFAWFRGGSLLPIAFAGLGVADLIAYFITKPPLDLQKSRANHAQLQTAYYNWFIDLYNWNSILGLGDPAIAVYGKVSEKTLRNTERTMKMIEDYCELNSSGNGKSPFIKTKTAKEAVSHEDGDSTE